MQKAEFWIERLQLAPHPEGGHYRETYRSNGTCSFPEGGLFDGPRSWATAIYYLLKGEERSRLHRIHSDELWFFHAGNPLNVYLFPDDGTPSSFTLGTSPDAGEVFQDKVPAETWFGAALKTPDKESYALVSCVVAPGFDFRDFTLGKREILQKKFTRYNSLIEYLT
ncbi:MAG: cupin domain-containing protein [Chlorobiaceae bacterium]